MRTIFAKTTLLALIALPACCGTAALGASDPGGAGAPAPSTGSAPARKAAHKASLATWFGPGFYGKQTACGQTMTPSIVGVANRTLPCGTLVKVTYDGHRLTLPVLDRGPYAKGVDWDLTAGAAQALGIEDTVRIATRVVGQTPNTPTLGTPPGAPAAEATGGSLAAPAPAP